MSKFTAQIYKIGINPVVDPPDSVLAELFARAGRAKGPIPVCGKLNGAAFVQTLVKYGGAWRLYINAGMLKDSGLQVGDDAKIEIDFDPRPREVPMPRALAERLREDKDAQRIFYDLPPSRRKEILRYIGSLKSQAAIDKNLDRIISHLRGEKSDHVLTRSRRAK